MAAPCRSSSTAADAARADPGRKFLYAPPPADPASRPPRSTSLTDFKDERPEKRTLRGASSATASLVGSTLDERAGPSGSGDQRWAASLQNLEDMGTTLESFQKALLSNAVYLDEEAYGKAVKVAGHGRAVKAQERRIRGLERELDASILAAARSREEKRAAEVAQRVAEARVKEVLEELENTTRVFKLHAEELQLKEAQLKKKDEEIQVLQAIISTMSNPPKRKQSS
ncbi:hypothetical protein KFL_004600150 [Klebsormidium nitens]|uniref:Uncharacterized protein n=1 Tax=Klebsormidium nitens TaxID=105231 RepID=A0A1Y1ICX1_KLENI|nr:hypothetical protein KFL_004600150 [Klebsormidium nitens]|eukprot:GAQ88804.1 hypothetical protein KFL_004600150 [Klebsormidium nitens]